MNREIIMKRWDRWRKYISEGGNASWPRDEFEILLDLYDEDIKRGKQIIFILVCIIIGLFANIAFAQDALQRHFFMPPYKGQMSAYSDWTIPSDAWNELTNCYVDEQGKIAMRPGFYCWLDKHQGALIKDIQGAYVYKKRVEGGITEYIMFTSDSNLYYTKSTYGSSPTAIEGLLTLSTSGISNWETYYNELFMANGENSSIYWDQNQISVYEVGRCYADNHSVVFEDGNIVTVALAKDMEDDVWGSYTYHFRVGMDLTIADSNNNGTYEIIAVDGNQITVSTTTGGDVTWTLEQSDTSVDLLGESYPDDISSSRTKTITYTTTSAVRFTSSGGTHYVIGWGGVIWSSIGFTDGMTVDISGSNSNDGSYTIDQVDYGGSSAQFSITGTFTAEYDTSAITFTGTKSITNGADTFDPDCIAGHKGRLFAGGVSEFPTKLYWSQSIWRDQYYWDLWRNSYGIDEGTGYYEIRDRIIALIGEWRDRLVIFCENSIHYLRGDDPGFDRLIPAQSLIFSPVPVSHNIGCVGPNAWCEANGDIYFYSREGLRKLSIVEQGGESRFTILSLPINDLHNDILEQGREKKIQMEFLKEMNLILINCAIDHAFNDSIITYNISNNSFSKWTFTTSSVLDPSCIFMHKGPEIDPNDTEILNISADPIETLWYGSRYGKLFAMCKGLAYDADYEDPTNAAIHNITMTGITPKFNIGQPFLEKTFQRTVFFCSPQINYDDASQGAVSFYRKIDDGSWSSAVTKSFDQHTESDGTAIDYYQFLDAGVAFKGGMGKTIQYKIEVSGSTGRYGLEFVGIMTEWLPEDYRI